MPRLAERITSQDWSRDYEVVPSAPMLLELTAHGANKGGMIERLAAIVNIPRRHVYCAGDHANDIPMLRFAHIPFAPANAIESVRRVEGVRILPHSRDDAIAAMIEQLDALY